MERKLTFTQLKLILAMGIISYFGACAPVQFEAVPEPQQPGVKQTCVNGECVYEVDEEWTIPNKMVDILIVNDNSGSMSPEQSKMAAAFSGFLASMETRGIDYRIAMTTTDIINAGVRPDNPAYNPARDGGKLQDGNLIEFAPGLKYLDQNTPNKQTLFNNAVVRPETLACEQSGFTTCPSGDERGIYAANLSIKKYGSSWMRPTTHTAVIALADEDERGVSKYNPANDATSTWIKQTLPLESMDEPQTFVDMFRGLSATKTMKWHSIIVRNNDTTCLNKQNGQINASIRGAYGSAYQMLSGLTGGLVGDICASDYTSQLQDIGFTFDDTAGTKALKCRPKNDQYQVSLDGQALAAGSYSADYTSMVWKLSDSLVQSGRKVRLKYSCAK